MKELSLVCGDDESKKVQGPMGSQAGLTLEYYAVNLD